MKSPTVYIISEQQLLQTGRGTKRNSSNIRMWDTDIITLVKYVSVHSKSSWTGMNNGPSLLLLVPGGLSDPVEGETCICPDLDGSCLSLSDSLLHRLHQVLSIVDQHLSSLKGEMKMDTNGDSNDTFLRG